MRQRLIDAAIECLAKFGYAATTTQLVIETAQVSRGAMVHHFPAKVDLMLAVAQHAAGKQNRHVGRRVAGVEAGMERYLALTAATWEVMSRPPAQALLEIIMGSRSDPVLAERLPPVVEALESEQRRGVVEMAAELGIQDARTVETMVRLHLAAMRGIAVDLQWSGDRQAAEDSMALLQHYKRGLTQELLTSSPDLSAAISKLPPPPPERQG